MPSQVCFAAGLPAICSPLVAINRNHFNYVFCQKCYLYRLIELPFPDHALSSSFSLVVATAARILEPCLKGTKNRPSVTRTLEFLEPLVSPLEFALELNQYPRGLVCNTHEGWIVLAQILLNQYNQQRFLPSLQRSYWHCRWASSSSFPNPSLGYLPCLSKKSLRLTMWYSRCFLSSRMHWEEGLHNYLGYFILVWFWFIYYMRHLLAEKLKNKQTKNQTLSVCLNQMLTKMQKASCCLFINPWHWMSSLHVYHSMTASCSNDAMSFCRLGHLWAFSYCTTLCLWALSVTPEACPMLICFKKQQFYIFHH